MIENSSSSMKLACYLSLVGLLLWTPLVARQNNSAVAHRLGTFKTATPQDPYGMLMIVSMFTQSFQAPFGLEMGLEVQIPPGMVVKPAKRIDLSGLDLVGAVAKLSQVTPKYAWVNRNGVTEVRSTEVSGSFLSTIVPHFELQTTDLPSAIVTVHRLFDAGFPAAKPITPGGFSSDAGTTAGRAAQLELLHRPITVSLTRATVADILDAIVVAHGEASWIVRYRQGPASYASAEIGFVLANGQQILYKARNR